jgi:hypothetical protein
LQNGQQITSHNTRTNVVQGTAASWRSKRNRDRPLLAGRRPMPVPIAVIQHDEPNTVSRGRLSTPS